LFAGASFVAACSGGELSSSSPPLGSASAGAPAAGAAGASAGAPGAAGAPLMVVAGGAQGTLTPPVTSSGGASNIAGNGGASAGSISAGAAGATTIALADDPGTDGDGMFTISSPYHDAPEFKRAAGVPQGKTFKFTFNASDSTIYPKAIDRTVSVYVPTQYKAGTPAAVIVFQDGTDFFGFDSSVPPVLDNLIASGKIPPVVAVFAGNGGGDYIGSERGLEYDTVSGLYAQWVDTELFPRVEQETKTRMPEQAVTFTKNPEGRAAVGGSSGGAASFSMAWWRSDLFRRAITFSGTYVNQVAAGTPFKHGAWVYHDIDPWQTSAANGLITAFCEKSDGLKTSSDVEPCDTPLSQSACLQVVGCSWNTSKNKPIRLWHEAGSNDLGAGDDWSSYRNFHLANQRMAQALKARGYHFHFDDAQGAGHVDQGPLRQTLPSALTWLWRGYRPGT
jgi:enterochelin esterase family protein